MMNDTTPTGVMRRPRRARPSAARTAAAIIAAAIVALLAAACSGSSTSYGQSSPIQAGSSSSQSAKLLAFSRCMRSHGVPQFPDPPFKLTPPNQQGWGGVSGSKMYQGVQTCRHLLPPGSGAWYPRSEIPRAEQDLRAFARCMRSHGISQWPDPSFDSQGRLAFYGPGADIPPGSAAERARNQCFYLAPLGPNTDLLGG